MPYQGKTCLLDFITNWNPPLLRKQNLNALDKRITQWFVTKEGVRTDSDFVAYVDISSTIVSEVDASLDSYYMLLENAGRIPKENKQDNKDVLQILQSL